MVPQGYDPTTLNHWLWWKYKCHEASGDEFQKLFEGVIKRTQPEFMSIRPYGKLGDGKADGLFFDAGVVFQVYSPDELTQANVQKKIREDLAGAVRHWKTSLKKWVFVYNVRRGLAPDIPKTLREQKKKFPKVRIDHLSSDALWEMVRGLSVQKRAEILGAPSSHDDLFTLALNKKDGRLLRGGRFVIVHDVLSPINVATAVEALRPHRPVGPPMRIRPTASSWTAAASVQRELLDEAIEKSRQLLPSFAVFSMSPVPLSIHLGFLLSDRVETRLFQYDRDRRSWTWAAGRGRPAMTQTRGLLTSEDKRPFDAIIRVSLSGRIKASDTRVARGRAFEIDIQADDPDVRWLRNHDQLVALGREFCAVLKNLRDLGPQCRRIHLFVAAPAPAAVTLGQAINPRMNPPVLLYQFSRQSKPRYAKVLTLDEHGT